MSEEKDETKMFDKLHATIASAQGIIYTFLKYLFVGATTSMGFIFSSGVIIMISIGVIWGILSAMSFFGITCDAMLPAIDPYGN